MKYVKAALRSLLILVYGYLASYYFSGFLNVAFNFSKGIANNPDGVITVPIGILIVLVILLVNVLLVRYIFKSTGMSKIEKWVNIVLFALATAIGTYLTLYSWNTFFSCLLWHLTH